MVDVLARCEELKPGINLRYEEYQLTLHAQRQRQKAKELEYQQQHQHRQGSPGILCANRKGAGFSLV